MMLITPILVMVLAGQAPVDAGGGQLAAAALAEDLKEPPTPPHTGIRALFGNLLEDIKHLPAMQNLYVSGGGGVLALAAHPVDARLRSRPRRSSNVIWAGERACSRTALRRTSPRRASTTTATT